MHKIHYCCIILYSFIMLLWLSLFCWPALETLYLLYNIKDSFLPFLPDITYCIQPVSGYNTIQDGKKLLEKKSFKYAKFWWRSRFYFVQMIRIRKFRADFMFLEFLYTTVLKIKDLLYYTSLHYWHIPYCVTSNKQIIFFSMRLQINLLDKVTCR